MFKNISLNQFIVPDKPILKSKETWGNTVDITDRYKGFALDRFTHRYYSSNQKSELKSVIDRINKKALKHIELIQKSSYSGLPYQIYAVIEYDKQDLEIYFDGFIFFITVKKPYVVDDLHALVELTSSELTFRNYCHNIIENLFNLDIRTMYSPFWDFEVDDNNLFGLSTDADYPGFQLTCNDYNIFTTTNLGDKSIDKAGRLYQIYFSESNKSIRDRLCHDIIIQKELDELIKFLKYQNSLAIEININFINSLKHMPGSIVTFFKRHKKWKSLDGAPEQLLSIEAVLPKYERFVKYLTDRVKIRTAYVNVRKIMWLEGENHNKDLMTQREVAHFFNLKYDNNSEKGFIIEDKNSRYPFYKGTDTEIKDIVDILNENVLKALKNLNNVTVIYSTNFGFDTLWIAIFTLFITIGATIISLIIN